MNRSIGRDVDGEIQKPGRQLAMVFDLNKCLGCHTCAIACKTQWTSKQGMEGMWWAVVNTMPGQGTPKGWEQMGGGFRADGSARPGVIPLRRHHGEEWRFNHQDLLFDGGARNDRLRPTVSDDKAPDWGPNWDEDQGGGAYPNSYYFYLPRICNHCTHPACIDACPRGSIYKRERDGIVLIDESTCKGFRFCMEACPYKRIYFNHVRQVSQKCIFCYPRVEAGVAPACSRQCPGRLRFVGYLDDEAGPIHKLVHEFKVALPLHPEYGTQPNVYYVPPLSPPQVNAQGEIVENSRRIPTEYLRSLFGPGVDAALATLEAEMARKRAGQRSELLDTLIVYEWPKDIFPDLTRSPADVAGDFHENR